MQLTGTRSSHNWLHKPGNWDRLNCRALYASLNEWGIPEVAHQPAFPVNRLIPYNDRYKCDNARPGDAVHFFLDDYRFETMWSQPGRALSRCVKVGAALTPDFSLWRDMPLAMQLWQVYRSRWCGVWMQEHGVLTLPTVSWSTRVSFPFAFAGIQPKSTVAISTVGILRDREARKLFMIGFEEMVKQLTPVNVMVYGTPLAEMEASGVPLQVFLTRWEGM